MSVTPRRPRLPGLQVPAGLDSNLRDFLEKLKERAEVASGDHRDPLSRFVTIADLKAAGLANSAVKNQYATISSAVSATGAATPTLSTTLDVPQSLFSIERDQLGDTQWMIIFDTITNTYRRIDVTAYESEFLRENADAEVTGRFRFVDLVADDADAITQLLFEDDDGVTGERVWQFTFDAAAFTINELDDEDLNPVPVLSIVRGGTAYIELYSDVRVYSTGGVVLAAPTGGDQGAGTINAEGYYRDGVELPYEAPIDGASYVRQDATWVLSLPGGASLSSSWKFDTGTTAVDPGNKDFAFNNATLASVTALYLNDTTVQGLDIGTIAGYLASGMRIYIQQKNTASKAVLLQVSGAATDNTGWWTIPVTVVSSSTLMDSAQECLIVFILAVGGGGGGGANLTYTAATRVVASDTGTDATLPLVTTGDAGLAPASGGGTANFLRADGTWAAPGGGGSTNLTYTAATRVVASDTGTDATLPLVTSGDAGLAPASGGGTSNFLRADGTWAAPSGGGGGGGYPPQLGFAGI